MPPVVDNLSMKTLRGFLLGLVAALVLAGAVRGAPPAVHYLRAASHTALAGSPDPSELVAPDPEDPESTPDADETESPDAEESESPDAEETDSPDAEETESPDADEDEGEDGDDEAKKVDEDDGDEGEGRGHVTHKPKHHGGHGARDAHEDHGSGNGATGLDNAIAHVSENLANHANRGLQNALDHLNANRAKH